MAMAILWKSVLNGKEIVDFTNPCKSCEIPFDERHCDICTQSQQFKDGFIAKITEGNGGYTSIEITDNPCNGCNAAGNSCRYCLPLKLASNN